jgi:radical SAM-linked protein
MVTIFMRALRRAEIPLRYSQGFHPKPKISFSDPLPVGMESEAEIMLVQVHRKMSPDKLVMLLQPFLPEGLRVTTAVRHFKKKGHDSQKGQIARYRIQSDALLEKAAIDRFHQRETAVIQRKSAKGRIQALDLKKAVGDILIESSGSLLLTLHRTEGPVVRPSDILKYIFCMDTKKITSCRILKLSSQSVSRVKNR